MISLLFPIFTDINGKKAVVVGGGTIGIRRAEVLAQFGALVTIVSPEMSRDLSNITHVARQYRQGDLDGAFLAVAATDDRKVNRDIGFEAKERGILVSVSDCREECTFYFPAICRDEDVIAGLISEKGSDHHKTAKTAKLIRKVLEEKH